MWNTDNPFLNGNYAPWREEGDAYDLEVEGEIPRDLSARSIVSVPIRSSSPRAATTGSTATGWSTDSSCATARPPIAIATSKATGSRPR